MSKPNSPSLIAHCLLWAAFLLVANHSAPVAVFAQSATATLSGAILDQSGAAVTEANITLTNPATGLKREAKTNSEGYFTFVLLPPGHYTVRAERSGFSPLQIPDVILNVGDQKAFSIQLKVGDVNAATEVRPDEMLIDTSPAVATTVDRTFVQNLPLNGRSFQSLILLTPGVVVTPSSQTNPGEYSVNGQRQNANYFMLDGVGANVGGSPTNNGVAFSAQAGGALPGTSALGTTSSLVSIDALEQFTIQTSTYSAEFGRQPGGQVQLITRSGSNQFRGTLFEYLRNEALDATDWFVNARRLRKIPLRQNQFGGTFSGPVFLPNIGDGGPSWYNGSNRTFFFLSYEGQRLQIPVVTTSPVVPSLRLRQAAPPFLRDILNSYPLPTGPEILRADGTPTGTAPFATAYSNPSSLDAFSFRLDHAVNEKLSLFGRYNYAPSRNLTRSLNQLSGNVIKLQSLTLGANLSITPKLNNDIRFNWTGNEAEAQRSLDEFGGAVPTEFSRVAGYTGPGSRRAIVRFFLSTQPIPELSLGAEADFSQRQINILDNMSYVKASQQFKFGFDWRRLAPIFQPPAYMQTLQFNNEASVISGTANTVLVFNNTVARPIYENFSVYFQDRYQPSTRLTLDLGLRWELNPAPREANGLNPVLVTGIVGNDVSGVRLAPPDSPLYGTFYNAFAPRIGVAYLMNKSRRREMAVRGGFGMYYDLGSERAALFGGFPFIQTRVLTNVQLPLSLTQAAPPALPTVQWPMPGQFVNAVDPNLKLPYTLQWNLALEQSMGQQQSVTLSYVGSAGRRLTVSRFLNNSIFPAPAPNPNIGQIGYYTNGSRSGYNALQVQYQRRLSQGLQALVNYTWSHAIDEASNAIDGVTLDRGNADFDIRHNLTAAISYDLPKIKVAVPSIVRLLANGWSMYATFYDYSGTPINLVAGPFVTSSGATANVRPDVVTGEPFWIRDPLVPGGRRLNPSAFSVPPRNSSGLSTRQGTLGRNVIHIPGIYQLNMAVRRQFNLRENLKLESKIEVFNLFNHPLFGGYNSSVFPGNTRLGVPTAMLSNSLGGLNALYQLGGPRSIQLSLRFSF